LTLVDIRYYRSAPFLFPTMPKQHVLFGRPLPRMPPRRISTLLALISIFAVFTLIFTLPSAIPTGPSLSKFADHKFSIPKFKGGKGWTSYLNPFAQPSHPPPRQKNDTHGDTSWYSDWKWLSIPFSSSITLDESRSLLPPMVDRPTIYCYYDTTLDKTAADKDAESALLLTWRRAWWAQGFRPVILSPAEAMKNPMYEEFQRIKMSPAMQTDMMRWLAWENMGGGLLAQYLLFPMGPRDDAILTYLRRGEYPNLTRWQGLGDGLFAGPKAEIAAVIKQAMGAADIGGSKSVLAALENAEKDPFTEDNTAEALAYYDAKTIETKYTKVGDEIKTLRTKGLKQLNKLINAHLHNTWQAMHERGISVLKPHPEHTSSMVAHAVELANRLATCSESPVQDSCPPNLKGCTPCVARQPLRVSTPQYYRNASDALFTIGVVPHPYTLQSLITMRRDLDVPWIRRNSKRDEWLARVTQELLGTGVSGGPRVLRFKEAVAGDKAVAHSLWVSAEKPLPRDVDWRLGFAVPATGLATGKSAPPVPGPERVKAPEHDDFADGPVADADALRREAPVMERARQLVKSKAGGRDRRDAKLREAVEAWNLADTEAWRFARAYLARAHVERENWESEEARYAGGAGTEKGRRKGGWGRWLDRDEDEED
jgi:hypothetical protein